MFHIVSFMFHICPHRSLRNNPIHVPFHWKPSLSVYSDLDVDCQVRSNIVFSQILPGQLDPNLTLPELNLTTALLLQSFVNKHKETSIIKSV